MQSSGDSVGDSPFEVPLRRTFREDHDGLLVLAFPDQDGASGHPDHAFFFRLGVILCSRLVVVLEDEIPYVLDRVLVAVQVPRERVDGLGVRRSRFDMGREDLLSGRDGRWRKGEVRASDISRAERRLGVGRGEGLRGGFGDASSTSATTRFPSFPGTRARGASPIPSLPEERKALCATKLVIELRWDASGAELCLTDPCTRLRKSAGCLRANSHGSHR